MSCLHLLLIDCIKRHDQTTWKGFWHPQVQATNNRLSVDGRSVPAATSEAKQQRRIMQPSAWLGPTGGPSSDHGNHWGNPQQNVWQGHAGALFVHVFPRLWCLPIPTDISALQIVLACQILGSTDGKPSRFGGRHSAMAREAAITPLIMYLAELRYGKVVGFKGKSWDVVMRRCS